MESPIRSNPTQRQAILDLLRVLAARHPSLELLVLFGSVARGEDGELSGVDLLVDGPLTRDTKLLALFRGELVETLGRPISVMTLSEGAEVPPVLAGAVRDGLVIADRREQWPSIVRSRPAIEAAAAVEIRTLPNRRSAALARLRRHTHHEE